MVIKAINNPRIIAVIIAIVTICCVGLGIRFVVQSLQNNNQETQINEESGVAAIIESSDNKNATDGNIDEDTDTDTTLDFDFIKLSNVLHSSFQKKSITAFISKCEIETTSVGSLPETRNNNYEVSENTIDTVINKLKNAKTLDKEITYSWIGRCPPKSITYYIGILSTDPEIFHGQSVFSLSYADDDNILLVGYDNEGYAFHFKNSKEIDNFIESLGSH